MEMIYALLKHILVTAVSYIVYLKIANTRLDLLRNVLFGVVYVIVMSYAFLTFNHNMEEPYRGAIVVIISSILLTVASKEKFDVIIVFCHVAYTISYILVFLATVILSIIFSFLRIYTVNIIGFIIIYILNIAFLFILSKLKIDMNYLRKKGVKGTILSLCAVIFILNSLFREHFEERVHWLILACIALIAYGVYCGGKRENTTERNEKIYEIVHNQHRIQINEQQKEIKSLVAAHDDMASKIHDSSEKLIACERETKALLRNANKSHVTMKALQNLVEINAYKEELSKELAAEYSYKGKTIPLTGLQFVDAKFEELLEKASKQNIDFDVKIIGEIRKIDQTLLQLELVNIVGILAKNAFIAIEHIGRTHSGRYILIYLGMVDSAYEISVDDSGIPFDIDTLVKLGKMRITSHANKGGRGYGYEAIFKIMKIHDASLTIKEYEPESDLYTKRVTFRFDGKASYTVISYRARFIQEQNTNNDLSVLDLNQEENSRFRQPASSGTINN